MSVSVPDFVEVHENQFVPNDEVTGRELKHAVELALRSNVPGNYYLRLRKAMTAFRRAGGTDSDVVMDVLCRLAGATADGTRHAATVSVVPSARGVTTGRGRPMLRNTTLPPL